MRKVYLISAELNGITLYKIGYTKREVEQRIKEFKTGNCSEFNIINIYEPEAHPVSIEKSLHKHFQNKKVDGEWFDLTQEDVESFIPLCERFYETFRFLNETNTYIKDSNKEFK